MNISDYFKCFLSDEQMLKNEPLKNHTAFKIGGPAKLFIFAKTQEEIVKSIGVCKRENLPYFVLGNGTNVLFSDKGFDGVVIKICKEFGEISLKGKYGRNCCVVEANSGVSLFELATFALENGLTGTEALSGIPASVGGAIYMNAGAHGTEMCQVVKDVVVVTESGEVKKYSNSDMQFAYRHSLLQDSGETVLSATFLLKHGDKATILDKMNGFNASRKDKQPLDKPSAGSTFKRPEGYYTGKLVGDSGLSGFSIGGAQISEKHNGFIINKGDATAQDVLDLIKHVQETVLEKFGVKLETEVKLIDAKDYVQKTN